MKFTKKNLDKAHSTLCVLQDIVGMSLDPELNKIDGQDLRLISDLLYGFTTDDLYDTDVLEFTLTHMGEEKVVDTLYHYNITNVVANDLGYWFLDNLDVEDISDVSEEIGKLIFESIVKEKRKQNEK